jgi:hypothetical protein
VRMRTAPAEGLGTPTGTNQAVQTSNRFSGSHADSQVYCSVLLVRTKRARWGKTLIGTWVASDCSPALAGCF